VDPFDHQGEIGHGGREQKKVARKAERGKREIARKSAELSGKQGIIAQVGNKPLSGEETSRPGERGKEGHTR